MIGRLVRRARRPIARRRAAREIDRRDVQVLAAALIELRDQVGGLAAAHHETRQMVERLGADGGAPASRHEA